MPKQNGVCGALEVGRGTFRCLLLLALALAPAGARAIDGETPAPSPPPATGASDLAALTGRKIYDRVLGNRFEAVRQKVRLVSGDRGGNEQESRMEILWKSFRDAQGEAQRGVTAKTLIRYTHPFDLRFSGYLIISRDDAPDDEFVYLASRRRVQRVNLRSQPVLGTDFSFEDVVPRELEDGDYVRLPDESCDGRACFVVDVEPRESADSEYSRFRVWVDQATNVVVRSLYWDRAGVLFKELRAPGDAIERTDGVFVPMRARMKNLQMESYTDLYIEEIVGNPELGSRDFDVGRLESH
jgi:Outer membrane lipoprotein-sorting protein